MISLKELSILSNSINITQIFINYFEKKVNKVDKLDSKKTSKEKQKYIGI